MSSIKNFLLVAREEPSSLCEKATDFLLTPARVLLPGKKVHVFYDRSISVVSQKGSTYSIEWKDVAYKILAFVCIPFVIVGALFKLLCLIDANYRDFCANIVVQESTCDPRILEMFRHIHNTKEYVTIDPNGGIPILNFNPLNLSECGCSGSHRFESPRRNRLENAIVARLSETIPDKTRPIHLLSMGSGGMMSDFLTLEKLILAGFTHINMDCVDPGIDSEAVERVENFFKNSPATIQLRAYTSIGEIPVRNERVDEAKVAPINSTAGYDAVLAVDFDDLVGGHERDPSAFVCASDLMQAYRRVGRDGFLALGFGCGGDAIFGKKMERTTILGKAPSLVCRLSQDLMSQLRTVSESRTLNIGIPSPYFANLIPSIFLSLALSIEKPDPYRTISIFYSDEYKNQNIVPEFHTMLQTLFPHITIQTQLRDETTATQNCDLLFTGEAEREFPDNSYMDFLKEDAVAYIVPRNNPFFTRRTIKANLPTDQQIQFFA